MLVSNSHAQSVICAVVKIEIAQTLSLERQAFDARMIINNGVDHLSLENLSVEVLFSDEDGNAVLASSDPNNTEAAFFIRVDSMEGVNDVSGAGVLGPSSTADIHWLIIPAKGAAEDAPAGKLYNVGARLQYIAGGEEQVVEVDPDIILVKPVPDLELDYFLPEHVIADDVFTPGVVEPAIPFTLGVRVVNHSFGVAKDLKIESAQPRIVENEQGLLVDFAIIGSSVNDQPATNSLLVEFGDLAPDQGVVARWDMTSSLTGRFENFEASFSHSDELGGALTSVISEIYTHTLVHNVLFDRPDRDQIMDFLAVEDGAYRIYESHGVNTDVVDRSDSAALGAGVNDGANTTHDLTITPLSTPVFAQLADPYSGAKVVEHVVRSDGKVIDNHNVWLSQVRSAENQQWGYYLNLFDVDSTGDYAVTFADPAVVNQPPSVIAISSVQATEEFPIAITVQANDPDAQAGDSPLQIQASSTVGVLPIGAHFIDQGDGTGNFSWTPQLGQSGEYQILFTASDGADESTARTTLVVRSNADSDGDGIPDSWEIDQFGSLDQGRLSDFDGDGIADLAEFTHNFDPTVWSGPAAPNVSAPEVGAIINALQPAFSWSANGSTQAVSYEVELYSDQGYRNVVLSQSGISEESWVTPGQLIDNHAYYWRVRAADADLNSRWRYGNFFVSAVNEAPNTPVAIQPLANELVESPSPALIAMAMGDIDTDSVWLQFELKDAISEAIIATSSSLPSPDSEAVQWQVPVALTNGGQYRWRAVATDGVGLNSPGEWLNFSVNTDVNAPMAPTALSPALGSQILQSASTLRVENVSHSGEIPISYFFELDTLPSFSSGQKVASGAIAEEFQNTSWYTSGLADNTRYFWRVGSFNGSHYSNWSSSEFFVQQHPGVPLSPLVRKGGDGSWFDGVEVQVDVHGLYGFADDISRYEYEMYSDQNLIDLLQSGETGSTTFAITTVDIEDSWIY